MRAEGRDRTSKKGNCEDVYDLKTRSREHGVGFSCLRTLNTCPDMPLMEEGSKEEGSVSQNIPFSSTDGWRRILVSTNFGKHASGFRKSIVVMAKRLCVSDIKNCSLTDTYLACRLILLEKSPGDRPIGIW